MVFMHWPEFAAALLASAIASIYSCPSTGFALGALVGGILGYIGIHWAKYVQF